MIFVILTSLTGHLELSSPVSHVVDGETGFPRSHRVDGQANNQIWTMFS